MISVAALLLRTRRSRRAKTGSGLRSVATTGSCVDMWRECMRRRSFFMPSIFMVVFCLSNRKYRGVVDMSCACTLRQLLTVLTDIAYARMNSTIKRLPPRAPWLPRVCWDKRPRRLALYMRALCSLFSNQDSGSCFPELLPIPAPLARDTL